MELHGAEPVSVPDLVHKMVQRIVSGFDPERVVLFGSHARGTAGADSDVDLLVVMPISGSKRATRLAIRKALHGIGLPKDIVVATPEEVASQRNQVGSIICPALREGRILYERRG